MEVSCEHFKCAQAAWLHSEKAKYVNNSSYEETGSVQDLHPPGVYGGGGWREKKYICMVVQNTHRNTHTHAKIFLLQVQR